MNVFDVCEAAELVHAVFNFWDSNNEQVVRFPAFAIYCVQPRSIEYNSHAFPCSGKVVSDTVYAQNRGYLTKQTQARMVDFGVSRAPDLGPGPWCESTLTWISL